jgi:uncharacterized protein DUF4350
VSRRARAALLFILAAGLFALLYPVWSRMERVEEEIHVGLRGEARSNPLLAAGRLLGRMGVPAQGFSGLNDLPPGDHLIVLAEDSRLLTRRQIDALTAWIAAGGRLVTCPASEESDPLLDVLGIDLLPRGTSAGGSETAVEESIKLSDPEEEFRIRIGSSAPLVAHLRAAPGKKISTRASTLLTLPVQSGSVTVVASLDFLRNEEIGDLDHARLLWRLVRVPTVPAGVWLIRGAESAPLIAILWRHGWMPIVSSTLLLAAWVSRKAIRFGPMLAAPRAGSRSLMEHLDAVGAFLWRRGRQEVLLESTRAAFGRALAARRPFLAGLPVAARSTALAAGAGVPRKDILSALAAPCPEDPDRFARAIGTLETLRRSL